MKPKIKISGVGTLIFLNNKVIDNKYFFCLQIQSHLMLLEKKYGESNSSINEDNVIRLKKSCGGTFNIKIPSYEGDEYFILQKFKTEDLTNKAASER